MSSVPTALGQAIQLANTIAQFPQECMRKDRANCYYTTFEAKSRMDAFQNEFVEGIKVVLSESVPGKSEVLVMVCVCMCMLVYQHACVCVSS